ncbi:MAG: hypothetical protein KDC48_10280, partial [Planctomycetes bacterium]|nr:hypothetical protein [Planctomycetota bacterium]
RVALGLRELDGVEHAPDVSDEVSRRLALAEPRAARSPWRWLTAVAALLAIAVTTAVLVQHNRGGGDGGTAEAQGQDPIGPSGAVRLVYELPAEELQRAAARKAGQDAERLIAETVASLQRRVGELAKVARGEGNTVVVSLPDAAPGDAAKVQAMIDRVTQVRASIEADIDLQMRIVAGADYWHGSVRFDLGQERERLTKWLAQPGNKELLQRDPRSIRRFNEDTEHGPEAFGKLAWYPHLILPEAGSDRWAKSYASIPALAAATLKVFTDAEYSGGVAAATKQVPEGGRFLVELLALNMDERHFSGADLDPTGVSVSMDFGVNYRIVAPRASEYGEWSEKYIGKCCAIVLDGVVRTAPRFEGRIPGRGVIHGLSREEAVAVARLLSLPLLVQPEFKSMERGAR